MGLEVFGFIPDLVDTNPVGATDFVNEGDDHLRGVKFTLQNQFPNIGQDQMLLTALELNDAARQAISNVFAASGGQTFNGALLLDDISDGQTATVNFRVNGFNVWRHVQRNSGGANDFEFIRHDLAGTQQSIPWRCSLATGIVEFDHVPLI
ncbi:MAG: hypothetical protein KAJ55_15935, partial [Anaerolineales bacterium]|nr:hypothetical protein [Anaerolineales bacterium]